MSSEATITEELIHNTADHLAGQGRRPTNDSVREVLADWTKTKGGSYATIAPALRAWKERQRASAEPPREAAPQPLVDRGGALVAELWAGAIELAMARLNSEREALAAARSELEADIAEALALAERREDEPDALKQAMSAQIAELAAQLDTSRADTSAKSERAASQQVRAGKLSRACTARRRRRRAPFCGDASVRCLGPSFAVGATGGGSDCASAGKRCRAGESSGRARGRNWAPGRRAQGHHARPEAAFAGDD